MRATNRFGLLACAGWLLWSAGACSDKAEIAREPVSAGNPDQSAGTRSGDNGAADGSETASNNGDRDAGIISSGNMSGGNQTPGAPGSAGAGAAGVGARDAGSPGGAGSVERSDAGVVPGAGSGGGPAGAGAAGTGGTSSLGPCLVSGCSNTVCADSIEGPQLTTCEFRPEYACYQSATCERQLDGLCSWTQSAALQDCITNANK